MKVALCISGELRTFNHPSVREYLKKHILDPLNPDIFISIWDHIGVSIHQENNFHELSMDVILDDIEKSYPNIKHMNIENFDSWLNNGDNQELKDIYIRWKNGMPLDYGGGSGTSVPLFYKMHDATMLKIKHETEHNFKYDIVLRVRPDILFVSDIDTDIKPNTVYHNNFGPRGWHWPNRIYDIFFYSDSETFDKVTTLWPTLKSLYDDNYDNGCGRLDACRTLYLQAIRNGVAVESINRRFCEVYRNVDVDKFIKDIKQYD